MKYYFTNNIVITITINMSTIINITIIGINIYLSSLTISPFYSHVTLTMTIKMTMRMTMKKLTPKCLRLSLTLVHKQLWWPTHLSIFACHICVSIVIRQILEIVDNFNEQMNNSPLHALKTLL